jgi:hypothetical protein
MGHTQNLASAYCPIRRGFRSDDASFVPKGGSDVTGIHQLFVRNPGWFSMFDADGPKAEATPRAFFDRVIAEKGMIAGYHFGFPNVGTLSKDGNGYAFAAVKA